jgi:hypothetical protein
MAWGRPNGGLMLLGFLDDEECRRYLRCLRECCSVMKVQLRACVLMSNQLLQLCSIRNSRSAASLRLDRNTSQLI